MRFLQPSHLDKSISWLQTNAVKLRGVLCGVAERNDELSSMLARYLHECYNFDATEQVNDADGRRRSR
jgi:hypothetical protein